MLTSPFSGQEWEEYSSLSWVLYGISRVRVRQSVILALPASVPV